MTTEIFTDSYTLSNGVNIPKLGLGTWFIDDDKAAQAVIDAVGIGYRHIDTAQAYENERGIGEGVRKCGIARNDLFITSKLAAEAKTYDEAVRAIDETLAKMNIEYLDLMLIHSPQPWADFRGGDYSAGNRDAWRALEDAYKAGKLRAIGVSNFKQGDIDNILRDCTVKPMVNQLLVHISNTPTDLISYSQSVGMVVEAYSPIAHGKILDVPVTTHNSCQNVHIIKNRPGKPGLPGFMPRYTGTAKRTTHVNATRKNAAFLGSTLHFGPMA